jgi:hypothetical protein
MTIACSLTPDELPARRAGLADLDVVDARVTARVTVRNEAALAAFVRAERECCPFFELQVTAEDGLFVLSVAGPPDAEPLIVQLVDELRPTAAG